MSFRRLSLVLLGIALAARPGVAAEIGKPVSDVRLHGVDGKVTDRHDLRDALDAILAGKAVQEPVTEAVGCRIFYPKEKAVVGKVTFYKDVLPVLQNHCQLCHRPGEVGPFSLMTYQHAVTWAEDI